MNEIYRVKIRGQVLESRDMKKLLARAVAEKRALDRRFRLYLREDMLRLAGIAPARDLQATS